VEEIRKPTHFPGVGRDLKTKGQCVSGPLLSLPPKEEIKKKEKNYLFNLGEIELKAVIDPLQNLIPAHKVSTVHNPNVGRHCLLVSSSLCLLQVTEDSQLQNYEIK